MILCGLDLETGGDFKAPLSENFITEVGLVLWDTDFKCPVSLTNVLVKNDRQICEDATRYTGITNAVCQRWGTRADTVTEIIIDNISRADVVVAHNGNQFDKPLVKNLLGDKLPFKIWVDTMSDIDYPLNCMSRNLTYLAGFHMLMNPFPHRAVTDVLTMLTILSKYDLNAVIDNAIADKIIITANVGYNSRHMAKDAGFSWENIGEIHCPKLWVKLIKAKDFTELRNMYKFPITQYSEVTNENKQKS